MKIYAISDIHGNLEGLDPIGYDIVVIAGDFTPLKGFSKWHLYDQKKWIQKKFLTWTSRYPNIDFIVVPGNHDKCLDEQAIRSIKDIDWRIQWPINVHLLINRSIEVKGLKFYGTPYVPIISYKWAFEANHDELTENFAKIPNDTDILITHSPPHLPNHQIDKSLQYGRSESFGSNELTQAIIDKKPKYVFCGHIHSGTHDKIDFESSKIYNVSRLDEDYKIAYEPVVIEL